MKKFITAICAAALLVSLAGCSNETASDGGNSPSAPESTSTDGNESTNGESSDSAPESTDSAPESAAKPAVEHLLAGFSFDEIELPDGTVLKKTEAVDGAGDAEHSILKFDVGVMRYSKPVFQSSLDDPDSFDWENFEFKEPVEVPDEDRVFTVRAGDVLENGMTVKSAYTHFEVQFGELYYKDCVIELEGEQTAEGIIYLREEDEYGAYKDDLEMYVDATKCENLPMRYEQYGETAFTHTFPDHKVAITIDGVYYDFGNVNDCKVDVSEVFLNSPFAKVKVTFKDPVLRITESTAVKVLAELVDIEVLG